MIYHESVKHPYLPKELQLQSIIYYEKIHEYVLNIKFIKLPVVLILLPCSMSLLYSLHYRMNAKKLIWFETQVLRH